MRTWIKLYTHINHDPDFGTLTWAQRGIWCALLALAGEIDDRDSDDRPTGRVDTVAHTAWRIRCDPAEFQTALEAFTDRGWIDVRDEVIYVLSYRRLQERAPSESRAAVSERVSRHRADAQRGCNSVTPSLHPEDNEGQQQAKRECNGVTPSLQPHGNDVTPEAKRGVTTPDSESESETDSESENMATTANAVVAATAEAPSRRSRRQTPEERRRIAVVRALREAFVEASGLSPPKVNGQGSRNGIMLRWWNPLREIAELVEWDVPRGRELIIEAVGNMRREGLVIAAPGSIMAIVRDSVARGHRDRRRYVTGPYADRIVR